MTKPEGFVAIVDGKAVKIVDRLEFSRANFTLEKSWRPPTTEGAKVAAFTFGRFNPPTTGHELLINKVKEYAAGNDYFVFPSHKVDKKKNPLTAAQKVTFMKEMYPSHKDAIIFDEGLRDVLKALKWLEDKGYTDAVMVVGSDQLTNFRFIKDYNGKDYTMNTVEIRSAGTRDPDADDVSGMSGTKMREAAQQGDVAAIKKGLPNTVNKNNEFIETYIDTILAGL
ncbi:MAG: DUF6267 family protein [Candidatus Fonsibacter ubiquis]